MAGFDDFLKAIQFGSGLMAGFTTQSEQIRQKNAQEQLQLLQLLQKDEVSRLVPISANEIEQPGGNLLTTLFGGGRARVRGTGEPATMFGGQGFALRDYPPMQIPPELLVPTTREAPTPAEPLTPPARPFLAPMTTPRVETPSESPRAARTTGETVAARHNNPLNVKLGPLTQKYIDTGQATLGDRATDGGQFLRFTSLEAGAQAARELIETPFYANRSVHEALSTWSNGGYGSEIVRGVIDPRTRVGDLSPEQKSTLLERMATQESGQPIQPGLFAGPGAVAARQPTESPTAPSVQFTEIPLPQARTEADYIREHQSEVYRLLVPGLRNTPKGQQTLAQGRIKAADDARASFGRDQTRLAQQVERIRKQTTMFEVWDALDRVTDINQLQPIREYISKNPEPSHLADSVEMLNRARPEDRDTLMASMRSQMNRVGITDKTLDDAWKPFITQSQQRAELPGVIARRRAEQQVDISGVPKRQAAELPGVLARKEAEASVFNPPQNVGAEIAIIQARMAQETPAIEKLSQNDFVKQNPDVLKTAQNLVDKRKSNADLDEAIQKQEAQRKGPLTPADAQRYVNPMTGARLPATVAGKAPTIEDAASIGAMPLSEQTQNLVYERLTALSALEKMKVLAFGGTDDHGVAHTGIFTTPAEGWGARARKTFDDYLKSVGQTSQLGVDIAQLRSIEDGLLGVYSRVFGQRGNLNEFEQSRARSLLPTVGLSSIAMQDSTQLVRQKINFLYDELVGTTARMIGLPPTDVKKTTNPNDPLGILPPSK